MRIAGDSLYLAVIMDNSYDVDFDFEHKEFPISVFVAGHADGKWCPSRCRVVGSQVIPAGEKENYFLVCERPNWDEKNNEAKVVVCLYNSWIMSQNSKPFKICD